MAESESADPMARGILVWKAEMYRQNFEGWQPGMSALDLAFNLGPESREYLSTYSIRERSVS
jgi:hypothetical protein